MIDFMEINIKKPPNKSWHYHGGQSVFESRFQEESGDFLLNFRKKQPNMTNIVLKTQDILREFWVNKTLRKTQ